MLIRTKLLLGFAAVTAATFAQGAYGAWSVATLNRLAGELYDRAFATGVAAQSARASFVTLDRAISQAAHATSGETLDAALATVQAADRFFRDDFDVLRERVHDDRGREMIGEIDALYGRWKTGWTARLAALKTAARGTPAPVSTEEAQAATHIETRLNMVAEHASQTGFGFVEAAGEVGRRALRVTVGTMLAAVVLSALVWFLMRRAIARPLGKLSEQLGALASGRLTGRVAVRSRDEVGQVAEAANRMADSLQDSISHLARTAVATTTASAEVAATAQALSGGTQEQAASLEETTASLEAVGTTARRNSESAGTASAVATEARSLAQTGGDVTREAVAAMGTITAAARRMSEIIGVVDDIAFQTNLLALNAAVEAARAGQHGRGFAVVASEVRNLAQRSAVAAREIKQLIRDSEQKIEGGATLVTRSGEALSEIVDAVARVSAIVDDIASVSREQAQSIEQLTRAAATIENVVETTASQTEELSATAAALKDHASGLRALVTRFIVDDTAAEAADPPPTTPRPASAPQPHRRVLAPTSA